jgi:hypothetical protein
MQKLHPCYPSLGLLGILAKSSITVNFNFELVPNLAGSSLGPIYQPVVLVADSVEESDCPEFAHTVLQSLGNFFTGSRVIFLVHLQALWLV